MSRIEGRNPVREAIRAGRPIRRVLVAEGTSGIADILASAKAAGVRVDRVPRAAIQAKAATRAHQGVVAEVEPFAYGDVRAGLALAATRGEAPLLLALDGVTDPHNLGSLLRSAEAAGAHAVLLPKRRSAPVTAIVEKVAAGATAHLVVAQVSNLERALAELRKEGIWIVVLDVEGDASLFGHPLLAEPVALVLGAEGAGVSRLIRERADACVRIPIVGKTGSLNVGVAGALALYEARRRRIG